MSSGPPLRLRRAIVLGASLALPLVLVLGLGHRGAHMMRSVLLPGAGLWGSSGVAAAACLFAALLATVAWVRWGMDWSLLVIVFVAVVASGLVTDDHAEVVAGLGRNMAPAVAAHEFPLVLLAAALISWVRGVGGRVPGWSHLARRRGRSAGGLSSIERLRPTDRSRTAALVALAGDTERAREIATDRGIVRRAGRVGVAARFRFDGCRSGGDPFRVDHAHARAALVLSEATDAAATERFVADAARTVTGVPCSEPTWVRPLDGTLAAIALQRSGGSADRWVNSLGHEFGLRRGHRPAWYWTPLGWSAGSAPAWEHAASTGLARAMGWIGDDDWAALRARALGASARGTGHPHDERLIAAARIWLVFVDDERAGPLLARPTVQHDPLAVALDRVATRLALVRSALADPNAHTAVHPHVPA